MILTYVSSVTISTAKGRGCVASTMGGDAQCRNALYLRSGGRSMPLLKKWGLQAQLGGEPQATAREGAVANKSGSMPIEVCTWSRCKGMLEDRVYSVCRRGCG